MGRRIKKALRRCVEVGPSRTIAGPCLMGSGRSPLLQKDGQSPVCVNISQKAPRGTPTDIRSRLHGAHPPPPTPAGPTCAATQSREAWRVLATADDVVCV